MITAVQHCRHDPHEAAVAVGALVDVARFVRLVIPLITVDGTHRFATDVIGIPIRGERAVVQPLDEVVHDVYIVDGPGAPDALQ